MMRIPGGSAAPSCPRSAAARSRRIARFVITTAVLSRVSPLLRGGPARPAAAAPGRRGCSRPRGGGHGGGARPRRGPAARVVARPAAGHRTAARALGTGPGRGSPAAPDRDRPARRHQPRRQPPRAATGGGRAVRAAPAQQAGRRDPVAPAGGPGGPAAPAAPAGAAGAPPPWPPSRRSPPSPPDRPPARRHAPPGSPRPARPPAPLGPGRRGPPRPPPARLAAAPGAPARQSPAARCRRPAAVAPAGHGLGPEPAGPAAPTPPRTGR